VPYVKPPLSPATRAAIREAVAAQERLDEATDERNRAVQRAYRAGAPLRDLASAMRTNRAAVMRWRDTWAGPLDRRSEP
jgi:hypothetical protein